MRGAGVKSPGSSQYPHGHLVTWMFGLRGASNQKIKDELGWSLRYESWRRGSFEVTSMVAPHGGTH